MVFPLVSVTVAVNCCVPSAARLNGPAGDTTIESGGHDVNVSGTENTPFTLAVMNAPPGSTDVANPLASMLTELGFELLKLKLPTCAAVSGVPFASNACALNCWVSP